MDLASKNIRLRHLRCFLAVAEAGSVTRAAAALNTSQPAVSRTLAELEQLIGRALFTRSAAGLTLSAEGEQFRRPVAAALAQIEAGARAAQGRAQAPRVVVAPLPNVMRGLVPAAAARFKAEAPLVPLRIRWAHVPALLQELQEGQVDMIVGRLLAMDRMSGLSFEQLFTEELVFAASPAHPLAGAAELTLEQVDAGLVVVPNEGSIIRTEMDRYLAARGFVGFARPVESISFDFTRAFLRQIPAVACVPLSAVRRELAVGALVRLPLGGDELMGPVGITTVSGRRLPEPAQRFAEKLREVVAEGLHISDLI